MPLPPRSQPNASRQGPRCISIDRSANKTARSLLLRDLCALAVLDPLLLGSDHVLPQVLALVLLLVDLLLNEVLVLGVVGVEDHDRLPAALALFGVVHLKDGRDDEDGAEGERQGAEGWVASRGEHGACEAADEAEGAAYGAALEDDVVKHPNSPLIGYSSPIWLNQQQLVRETPKPSKKAPKVI
ncbi:hypothetical protein HYQ44_011568 [Verticillium longisporum]|nr:hypothetical protein HYQ44_011568 [Verticillium longisporum]